MNDQGMSADSKVQNKIASESVKKNYNNKNKLIYT